MEVTLRNCEPQDLALVEGWAQSIESHRYMSHHVPYAPLGSPQLAWYIIRSGGEDVGTVWLEYIRAGEVRLGILIGVPELMGRGIGSQAIQLAVAAARASMEFHVVSLRVRTGNHRAIACYRRCGFDVVDQGVKRGTDGTTVTYLVMQRTLGPDGVKNAPEGCFHRPWGR